MQGTWYGSKYTDITTLNKVLRNFLEPGERVKADKGYCGHPEKIKCPGNNVNPVENWEMQGRVRDGWRGGAGGGLSQWSGNVGEPALQTQI